MLDDVFAATWVWHKKTSHRLPGLKNCLPGERLWSGSLTDAVILLRRTANDAANVEIVGCYDIAVAGNDSGAATLEIVCSALTADTRLAIGAVIVQLRAVAEFKAMKSGTRTPIAGRKNLMPFPEHRPSE